MIKIVKVSVVVPIYNAGKYIGRCVESILNQNIEDFELILVNDGSTDNSLEIINKYSLNDNIRIINKSNGGVSSARNAGLDYAVGDYIGFVDSDDWIQADMYSSMYNLITAAQSDICICNYFIEYPDHRIPIFLKTNKKILFKDRIIHDLILNMIAPKDLNSKSSSIMGSACRLLVKREFIQQYKLRFPLDIPLMEDLIFCINALIKCNKLSIDNGLYYHYSIKSMVAYRSDLYMIHKNVYFNLERIVKENNIYAIVEPRLNIRYVNMCISAIHNEVHKKNKKEFKEKINTVKNIINDKILKHIIINTCTKNYRYRRKAVLFALKYELSLFLYIYYKIASYKTNFKYRNITKKLY